MVFAIILNKQKMAFAIAKHYICICHYFSTIWKVCNAFILIYFTIKQTKQKKHEVTVSIMTSGKKGVRFTLEVPLPSRIVAIVFMSTLRAVLSFYLCPIFTFKTCRP